MILNYFKTAWRNIIRNRFFSLINIIGLAMAMSVSMILIMLVVNQLSYDKHNQNGATIFRINSIGIDEKGMPIPAQENASTPPMLGLELKNQYVGIKEVVRLRQGFGNAWTGFQTEQVDVPISGFFADEQVLEFFDYRLEFGDAATALKEPYSVVLTRDAANKLFKDYNPVGQTIKVGNLGLYKVTGILKETNQLSHIAFEGLASMSSVTSLEQSKVIDKISDSWTDTWNVWTYVQLEENKTTEELQAILNQVYEKNKNTLTATGVYQVKFLPQSIWEITPGELKNNPIGPQLPWVIVYVMAGLGLVILLTACFNFTNLSIARSLTRAREIGVRKVTGASRWQIFLQFISESILVSFFALLLGSLVVLLIQPYILQLNIMRAFQWNLAWNSKVFFTFTSFALFVGLLAGFFPAVVLSGFQPIHVLKNLTQTKVFSRVGIRKFLIAFQFALTFLFLLTVIVANQQLSYFSKHDHGFEVNKNKIIKLNGTNAINLKTELSKLASIHSISAVSHIPAAGTSVSGGFKLNSQQPDYISSAYFFVDEDYDVNVNLRLIAGNFFNKTNPDNNKNNVVINEVALKIFQFKTAQEAIGQSILFEKDTIEKKILGVVANYNHRTLTHQVEPLVLLYQPKEFKILQVRYLSDESTIHQQIEKVWSSVNPGLKIEHSELKEEITHYYNLIFGDLISILSYISILAIILSCLGLLGMAAYTAETRLKEVSIRKILGSSNTKLIVLLSKDYFKTIAWAIGVALPLSMLMNNFWLQMIAYHTTINLSMIVSCCLLLIIISSLTIISQALRAVRTNPLKNIKVE